MNVYVEACGEIRYRLVTAIVGTLRPVGRERPGGKRERNGSAAAEGPPDGHRRRHGDRPDLPSRGGPAAVRRVPADRQPRGTVAADGLLRRVRGDRPATYPRWPSWAGDAGRTPGTSRPSGTSRLP